MTKRCSKCEKLKPVTSEYFYRESMGKDGFRGECKVCKEKHTKKWRQGKGKEYLADMQREWRVDNWDKWIEWRRNYCHTNVDKINAVRRIRYANGGSLKIKGNVNYRIASRLRNRITHALKRQTKSLSTNDLIGCDTEYFKKYFFSLFTNSMTITDFVNGKIHIDHIIPVSFFNMLDEKEQKTAFHYTNMQPLWAEDNFRKGIRIK